MITLMKAFLNSVPFPIWLLFLATSFIWIFYPQIDLQTSGLFYTPEMGFYSKNSWWEMVLYKSVPVLLIGINVLALGVWIYNRINSKTIAAFDGKKLLFALLVLGIGSGLIVNALLKDHWGRARPIQIEEFGGKRTFTPAFVLSDQNGNSFSSGHASGAFALIAYALLARRKKLWMTLALLYGFSVGYARMAAGGHFLSDVVVSFFIMYITAKMLYYLFFERISESDS